MGAMRLTGGPIDGVQTEALIQRNSHRSTIHGLRDAGAALKYVFPEFNNEFDVFLPVSVQ